MIKVAPSILSADYVNLQKDIEKVEKAGCTILTLMLWMVPLFQVFLWTRLC